MKKLLLSLMVLASLVSCGKDNKVSSGSSSYNYSNAYLSGTGATYASDLVAKINNYSANFGNGQIYTSSSNQTCGTKWGFINYCYGSSGSNYATTGLTWNALAAQQPNIRYLYSDNTIVTHSAVNIATKQQELITLLNSATNIQVSGTLYYIQVTSGAYYVIDTRYPLQTNPSAVTNGYQTVYFYQAI